MLFNYFYCRFWRERERETMRERDNEREREKDGDEEREKERERNRNIKREIDNEREWEIKRKKIVKDERDNPFHFQYADYVLNIHASGCSDIFILKIFRNCIQSVSLVWYTVSYIICRLVWDNFWSHSFCEDIGNPWQMSSFLIENMQA